MTTGTSSWKGLGMGLQGEHEITQLDSSIDMLTLSGASTSGTGLLFVIQNSAKTPAVNGLRVYDYGRTRIIRTDDATHGSTYNNALDVKYDINYAMGGQQVYAATFILDIADGSAAGGRQSVIQLQSYGNSTSHSGMISSWIVCTDLSAAETSETGTFVHFQGQTIGSGNMMEGLSSPGVTHGLVMYWDNTKYWIMVTNVST